MSDEHHRQDHGHLLVSTSSARKVDVRPSHTLSHGISMVRRKLSEAARHFLKLLSGRLMGGLGLIRVLSPERLSSPLQGIVLIGVGVAVSLVAHSLCRSTSFVFH
jgi:hypothetical protein